MAPESGLERVDMPLKQKPKANRSEAALQAKWFDKRFEELKQASAVPAKIQEAKHMLEQINSLMYTIKMNRYVKHAIHGYCEQIFQHLLEWSQLRLCQRSPPTAAQTQWSSPFEERECKILTNGDHGSKALNTALAKRSLNSLYALGAEDVQRLKHVWHILPICLSDVDVNAVQMVSEEVPSSAVDDAARCFDMATLATLALRGGAEHFSWLLGRGIRIWEGLSALHHASE